MGFAGVLFENLNKNVDVSSGMCKEVLPREMRKYRSTSTVYRVCGFAVDQPLCTRIVQVEKSGRRSNLYTRSNIKAHKVERMSEEGRNVSFGLLRARAESALTVSVTLMYWLVEKIDMDHESRSPTIGERDGTRRKLLAAKSARPPRLPTRLNKKKDL